MYNILVCDDEKDIVSALTIYLTTAGYQVFPAYDGTEALDLLRREDIHLVLLDIMMPKLDGIAALTRLREASNVPVILLTAKSEDTDKIQGLNLGADDYVTKPFSPAELTARVDALLRRAGDAPLVSAAVGEISQPPFLLNMTDRVVEKNGKRLKLTQLEYQIMKLFMENPDKALTREEILDTVWGRGYFGEVKIVDVNIRRLRLKIEDDAQEPRYIATVWGTGYKWSTD